MTLGANTRLTRYARPRSEKGASLVEFALVAPLLLLLLLGMIEFGWLFGQYNEVRHAAREGARFAAVSNSDFDQDGDSDLDANDVLIYTCNSLNLPGAATSIDLSSAGSNIGDQGTITITADVGSLSGAPLISSFLPDELSNTATFRLEQGASWGSLTAEPCP